MVDPFGTTDTPLINVKKVRPPRRDVPPGAPIEPDAPVKPDAAPAIPAAKPDNLEIATNRTQSAIARLMAAGETWTHSRLLGLLRLAHSARGTVYGIPVDGDAVGMIANDVAHRLGLSDD